MRVRRMVMIAAAGAALAAGGAGAAIGATGGDDGKAREQALLEDAAKRLDRTPEQLRSALRAAQDAQLDAAVRRGELTQEQADAIKQRRNESGRVLGFPGGPRGHHGGRGFGFGFGPPPGGRGVIVGELAKALGVTRAELREQLRDGRTVAEIAKAQGKSLADVRAALRAAARTRIDKAVADGDLTRRQADRLLEHVDEHLERLGEVGGVPGGRFGRHHGGMPPEPPAGDEDPAGFAAPSARGSWS